MRNNKSKFALLKNICSKFRKSEYSEKNGGNGKTINQNSAQLLSALEYFCQRYHIELRRAERKDYEFSLIIIDLLPVETKINGIKNKKILVNAEKLIFSTAKSVIRDTDVIVQYQPYKIAILLPDTGQAGGELVLQRIDDSIQEIAGSALLPIINNVSTHLFSYPSQETEMNQLIHDRILNIEPSKVNPEGLGSRITKLYSGNNHQQLNFKGFHLLKNQNGALVLENPISLINDVITYISLNWQKWLKRILDIFGASLGIIILSPVIIIASLLIKLTSSGPIFFRQTRTGYMGKKYLFYKFRTMFINKNEQIHKNYIREFIQNNNAYKDDSANGGKIYKMTEDSRITPVGKFLRRTSVDELPQLFNVLKGDMSLVGPRPPIPYEVELYDLWHRRRFLEAKPGITGLWQIHGRSAVSFNEMVRLDLAYVNNWSIWLDLKILLKTIKIVLLMKGAY